MAAKAHFQVLGFSVHVHPFAMAGAALAVLLLREVGLVIVGVFALSILVHELGHSLAFRRYGTESHIVIHPFGGYSMPDQPHKLNHSEWVLTSLAGPAAAFFLLGLPAWILREFGIVQYGYTELTARIFVYFCVYWGAVNLLPIWPLDGGKILYHGTGGNWQMTKVATIVLSVPAMYVAVQFGYRFAAIFIAFNAYRVLTGPAPGGSGLPGNSRISGAAKRAKAYAAKPTKTRGTAGNDAVDLVYRELIRGRADRAAEPMAALSKSKHRDAAELASSWGTVLSGNTLSTAATTSPLLQAVVAGDLAAIVAAFVAVEPTLESAAALRALHNAAILDAVCAQLSIAPSGVERLRALERQTLDLGMVDEQMRVTAAISSASGVTTR